MSAFHDNALMGASGSQGYQISRSVRLRSSASAYFNRTPASAGNRKTWTWSGWVKRGTLGAWQSFLHAGTTSTTGNFGNFGFNSSDQFDLEVWAGAVFNTSMVFRDVSAWYHIVLSVDTTQATVSDRLKFYVNGAQVTAFATNSISTYYTQNYDTAFNQAIQHSISSRNPYSADNFFDGYFTEINFIDGQALTPSSFGETDAVTGVWKPKKYAGTYGTNGFYLNFSDNSNNTATTIGKDYSGNGNNWTPNNISVTSGATYDSMLDVPTPYADGGNGRGNYAVLNPLDKAASASVLNGNLRVTSGSATALGSRGTFQIPTTGKWYYEGVVVNSPSGSTPIEFGCATDSASLTALQATGSYGIYVSSAISYMNNGTASGSLGSLTAGDIIQFAGDCDNGRIWIGKNNVYWDASSGTTGSPSSNTNPTLSVSPASMFPLFLAYNNSIDANFGQRPFAYTPPSGFKALNTQNLPEPIIKKGNQYFDATTYTGNGTNTTVTNSGGFTPDLVWHKGRSVAYSHSLVDSVRGNSNILFSNTTDAESNPGAQLDITTNGFISTYRAANLANNQNGATYVGWQWKAGGSGSSNTSGSITSTVSVNATAGFSVVTYTGIAGNVAKTFGHGLGVAPSMVIVKGRDAGSTGVNDWVVWHSAFTGSEYIYLDLTNAKGTSANYWGATVPSSTVVTVGGNSSNVSNESGIKYVAYCFSAVAGYSAFGSYTGNGSSDGPFVFCGFRPRWVMVKNASTGGAGYDWYLWDSARQTYNVIGNSLAADLSDAEFSATNLDFTSNGFKLRTSSVAINNSGNTIIYAAFAENPFKYALAR